MACFLAYTTSYFSSLFKSSTSRSRRCSSETEPFVQHKSLCEADLLDNDLLIVGDVHGCYDEMLEIIKLANDETKKPLVNIFVGDMINKGPKSEEVLEYLLKAKHTYCVRGNHEQKVLKEFFSYKNDGVIPSEPRTWVKKLKPAYVDFMKSLPYTISIAHLNLVIVHAGLLPGRPLTLQSCNEMINMRNLYWDDDMFHGKVLKSTFRIDKGQAWADNWKGPEHVYFGHDAVRKLQTHEYATGLDTGCVYGGHLSAMLLKLDNEAGVVEKKLLTVKPNNVYVPVTD